MNTCRPTIFSLDGEMQRDLAELQAQLERATGVRIGRTAALRVIFRRAKAYQSTQASQGGV